LKAGEERRGLVVVMAWSLAGCAAALLLSAHSRMLGDETLLLAVCALIASATAVEIDRPLLIDGSFVPSILAAAFLGPAPAITVAAIAEFGSWPTDRRRRPTMVCVNLIGICLPNLLVAGVMSAFQRDDLLFFAVLTAACVLALALNAVLVTSMVAFLEEDPAPRRLTRLLSLTPPFGINAALAVGAAAIYVSAGAATAVVVLVMTAAFNYVVRQAVTARTHAERLLTLAKNRERLVAEALDAEGRARGELAASLHDGAVQTLLTARQDLADIDGARSRELSEAITAIDQTLQHLRGAIRELHPAILRNAGLESALQAVASQHARRGGFTVALSIDPEAIGTHDTFVLSTVRELLANAATHANASTVFVELRRLDDEVALSVRDDGRGFAPHERAEAVRKGHVGLESIRDRVTALEGTCEVDSSHGAGTQARVTLPLPLSSVS